MTELEDKGFKWGIVTNKLKKFTIPVLEKLNILKRTSCIICGDSTPNPKPHPAPLQLACKELNVNEKTVFMLVMMKEIFFQQKLLVFPVLWHYTDIWVMAKNLKIGVVITLLTHQVIF